MDEQRHLLLLHDKSVGRLIDKTSKIQECWWADGRLQVRFDGNPKPYPYKPENVDIRSGEPEPIPEGRGLAVRGELWVNAVSMTRFGDKTRVTTRAAGGDLKHYLYESSDVTLIDNAAATEDAAQVLAYWRALVSSLKPDDPTRKSFERLGFIHPESALATYLRAAAIDPPQAPVQAIYPFSSNISQRDAVDQALGHQISVIEGPPGTGKTQTILNIVASIVAEGDQSVAVVSSTNSAVDNVREKLDALGVGYIAAALGNMDNQAAFVASQGVRIAAVAEAMAQPAPEDVLSDEQMDRLTRDLRQAQQWDRDRARLETEVAAYRLEHRHFIEHLEGREVLDLDKLPLLRKASNKILDYLAETSVASVRPGLITRIRRYFAYGRTGDIDPQDVAVVLRLQEKYYERRTGELEQELAQISARLERAGLEGLISEHTAASHTVLQHALRARYGDRPRRTHSDGAWRRNRSFLDDYPVVLSTCHSLAQNLPRGHLVDLLIIDEASQVSLLVAAVAMACAKRVVVVGDTRQLPHIPGAVPEELEPPHPAYDHRAQNLLSSLHLLYGSQLPSTMLLEHYRCAPEIIGFCNRSFYDGKLISFTRRGSADTAMRVWTTVEGNHMRALGHAGGTMSQREIDIIRTEVIPAIGLIGREVGYIAPYRRQADELSSAIVGVTDADGMVDISVTGSPPAGRAHADTVHRFQGRESDVVVMSSVVDNSWRGQRALNFVDDARLINVAVSRAVNEFVLVTHHDRHPKSRYLADLIGYIEYHDPEAVRESSIVSIFDLLYKNYSARLKPFAKRVHGESKYTSENAAGTLIEEILAAEDNRERYGGLSLVGQYRLSNLFTNLDQFTLEQQRFIKTTSSVDFLIYRTVSLRPVLAIEVDGVGFHAGRPEQLARDAKKDSIFDSSGLPLLRLKTDGSGERERVVRALEAALDSQSVPPDTAPVRRSGRPGRARHRASGARPE